MRLNVKLLVLGALIGVGASAAAGEHPVYKCGSGRTVTYTEKPCSGRVVNTEQAEVPVKSPDARRLEQQRVIARSLRQRPDETAEQFELRRRRAALLRHDREECERIEVRMPVEQASLKNPDPDEVAKAEAALEASRKRFKQLHC